MHQKSLSRLTLVLGGAASGKSAFAEALILKEENQPLYIATAHAWDDEMAEKIRLHRERRAETWITIEAPTDLRKAITEAPTDRAMLIDCATLWLSNHLLAGSDLTAQNQGFLNALGRRDRVVVVSNEVGQGIVPETALGRQFRNAQGALNQALAAQADLVVQVIAGLPQVLKGTLP